ncbi:MAG: hypothetical protein GC171_03120 [Terrimonas sp.]|nr:hypothetical protein [Terrimonas sp.]
MKIVVDIRSCKGFPEMGVRSLIEFIQSIKDDFPGVEFIFLVDEATERLLRAFPEFQSIHAGRQDAGFLKKKLRKHIVLPALIKKQKPRLIISFHPLQKKKGRAVIWMVHDRLLLKDKKKAKKIMHDFASAGSLIITTLPGVQTVLAEVYKLPVQQVRLLTPFPVSGLHPHTPEEKQAIREQYAGGKEYFLFYLDQQDENGFRDILKAFSQFKKRLQSSLKIVFVMPGSADAYNKLLSGYKYRDDVVMVAQPFPGQLIQLSAAAYAVIVPGALPGYTFIITGLMQLAVPVIGPEPVGDENAVLICDTANRDDLFAKMSILYKDEKKRAEQLASAARFLEGLSLQRSATEFSEYIKGLLT